MSFSINARLIQDSYALLVWRHCHLRLQHNATLPWFLIVPETQCLEFHELEPELQQDIMTLTSVLSDWMKADGVCCKINFAAIGNVVSQLHIHVIGRHPGDPFWPDVVWGQALPEATYSNDQLAQIASELQRRLT